MTHVNCRLTAKYRDQLRNPRLVSRVWAACVQVTAGAIGRREGAVCSLASTARLFAVAIAFRQFRHEVDSTESASDPLGVVDGFRRAQNAAQSPARASPGHVVIAAVVVFVVAASCADAGKATVGDEPPPASSTTDVSQRRLVRDHLSALDTACVCFKVSVSAVFCLDILQLYSTGLSFVWHSVYFVQL